MTTAAKSAPAAKGGLVHETVEIVKTIVYALLIALVLKVVVFQPYTIPSASEEPNLYEGDYIIVSKWSYGWSRHSIPFSPPLFHGRIFFRAPQRGDIIVFKLPCASGQPGLHQAPDRPDPRRPHPAQGRTGLYQRQSLAAEPSLRRPWATCPTAMVP